MLRRFFFGAVLFAPIFLLLTLCADALGVTHPAELLARTDAERQRVRRIVHPNPVFGALALLFFALAAAQGIAHHRTSLRAPRSRALLAEPGSLAWLRAHRWMPRRVLATAYFIGPYQDRRYPCMIYDGQTADGARVHYGSVAVDPRVIPFHRELYVPGYGFAVADDTGGLIDGSHIDLARRTCHNARVWGARHVTIWVAPA